MSAAERLAALDNLPATELCALADAALDAFVKVMNEETTLLRTGHVRQAGVLTPEKIRLAQDYVGFARSVQRQLARLQAEAPADLDKLQSGHERLATQLAENLRVIATGRNVTEDILVDVSMRVGQNRRTKTYGAEGKIAATPAQAARGISINRAL